MFEIFVDEWMPIPNTTPNGERGDVANLERLLLDDKFNVFGGDDGIECIVDINV